MQRHNILAPVPYRLGWSRSSCMKCIYNNATIWATIGEYFPEELEKILAYELEFGTTIHRSKKTVAELANRAQPLEIDDLEALKQATQETYNLPVFAQPGQWQMPAGAFGTEGCGAV